MSADRRVYTVKEYHDALSAWEYGGPVPFTNYTLTVGMLIEQLQAFDPSLPVRTQFETFSVGAAGRAVLWKADPDAHDCDDLEDSVIITRLDEDDGE